MEKTHFSIFVCIIVVCFIGPTQIKGQENLKPLRIIELDSISNVRFGDFRWGERRQTIFPTSEDETTTNKIQEFDYEATLHFFVKPRNIEENSLSFIWNSKSISLKFCLGNFFAAKIWFQREWTHPYLREYLVNRFGKPKAKKILADGFKETWETPDLEIELQNWAGYTILELEHLYFKKACNRDTFWPHKANSTDTKNRAAD